MARGMIRKRGDNWYIVYPGADKKKTWEVVGPRKREAEKLLAARLDAIRKNIFPELKDSKRMRFRELAHEWTSKRGGEIRPTTAASQQSIVNCHLLPHFGEQLLVAITMSDIELFLEDLRNEIRVVEEAHAKTGKTIKKDVPRWSAKTRLNIFVLLKKMLSDAVRWKYLYRNPADHVKRPRVPFREMRYFTPDQVRTFLNAVRPQFYSLFLTVILTGLRRGELLALQWRDIDLVGKTLQVRHSLYKGEAREPKTEQSRRTITLSHRLVHELKKHRIQSPGDAQDFVFANGAGKALDPDNFIKRVFDPVFKGSDLPKIRFHDLRHTHAALLISQGENVKMIQNRLGHASVQTTLDRYGHIFPQDEREAAKRLEKQLFGA